MSSLKDYTLSGKIGSGSFGKVYIGIHNHDNKRVAIKLENLSDLAHEAKILKELSHHTHGKDIGIPKHIGDGPSVKGHYIIMKLLGKNLEEVFTEFDRKLSKMEILSFGVQMISRIEEIHEKMVIHRDIKPQNFVFGRKDKNPNKLYLIDFGLARKFMSGDGEHIPLKEDRPFIGNGKFASLHAH